MAFIAHVSTTLPGRFIQLKTIVNASVRPQRPSSGTTIILADDPPVSRPRFPGQCSTSRLQVATAPPLPAPQSAASPPWLLAKPPRPDGYLPRCTEKGCVFPQARPDSGKCRQHERQFREPDLFVTRQPSVLLLDRAKFDFPESGFEEQESRAHQRRNWAKLWQRFQDDGV